MGGSLKLRQRPSGRRILVGDLQGCRAELEELLERLRFDPSCDELHPVGDFVNRGPDSLGTLRLCRELKAGGVLGNHDQHLLRAVAGERALGPRDTLDALLAAPDRDELCTWLAERPFVRAWDDVLIVHAGLHPRWRDPIAALAELPATSDDPRAAFATRVRYCTAAGQRPSTDDPPPAYPFAPWFAHLPQLDLPQSKVVFGHWSRLGLVVERGLRGLDTGCVWGRELTAWIAEEDRLVSVKAHRTWSPVDP